MLTVGNQSPMAVTVDGRLFTWGLGRTTRPAPGTWRSSMRSCALEVAQVLACCKAEACWFNRKRLPATEAIAGHCWKPPCARVSRGAAPLNSRKQALPLALHVQAHVQAHRMRYVSVDTWLEIGWKPSCGSSLFRATRAAVPSARLPPSFGPSARPRAPSLSRSPPGWDFQGPRVVSVRG